ncbi:MAG: aminoacyl-tRNA hydrolase [Gammaproteobacteria bacterium]|nr:aminoacyl-tRNA hydrolase [Gammaproteobacteria bacterium]NIR85532.1 aminoacyl-tRNA hydrolase [Gammaproteobacteria bacterium]NIR89791.1 aminoacyl-tRNA hydrolase [Gammaproteobacteria bacterium]NIU06667.1 aminoacyl-tRNA hydrolase [Gammaproteobacteria bacterium]NIV75058.1 aminoacyl-tRNA hydrolase [Gammaproteobacteria bacterium]
MLEITPTLAVDEAEIDFRFVRASGPGGQKVNKVATAVQLRFDVRRSESLPAEVCERLLRLARNRINRRGVLIIDARRFRTQERNRQDALERLAALVRRAAERPRPRRKTHPSRASRRRRVQEKRHRGEKKRLRAPVSPREG